MSGTVCCLERCQMRACSRGEQAPSFASPEIGAWPCALVPNFICGLRTYGLESLSLSLMCGFMQNMSPRLLVHFMPPVAYPLWIL